MKTSSLRKTIEFIGLDYKKEMAKVILINLLLVVGILALIYYYRQMIVIMVAGMSLVMIDYMIFNGYGSKKEKMIRDRSEEFIEMISYFETFITNHNNVYQSFTRILEYSSPWMHNQIEYFLHQIDNDKTVKPFTDFAELFAIKIARNVMLSIYQMVEQGETSLQLVQFMNLFDQMSRTSIDERKDKKQHSFSLVSSLPMIGAALISVALSLSIMSFIGDINNVI